jgi:glycosyltransferase involved in cell wall biosynthesis
MTADTVGGVWTYALDLARGLTAAGTTVTLLLLGPPPSPAQRAGAEGLRLVDTGLPLDWLVEGPAPILAAGQEIAGRAVALGADLLQLNSAALAAAGSRLPVVAVCHSCLATWWQAVRQGPLPDQFRWHRALMAQAYARADRLVAPSAAFAAATQLAYGLPVAPHVVHNGRPAATIPAMPSPVHAFTAGRLWDEGKNLATLDAAAAQLDLPFLAAGPMTGPHGGRAALHHLRPLGTLDAAGIAQHLARQPIFASAARYEPFGLAVLEAAQAGCPLVLADIPAFRELWSGAASFVAPEDQAGFAAAIAALAADPALRRQRGAAARDRAARYSLTAMTTGMLAQYDALLQAEAVPA